jgi:hypothetical protein
LLAFGENRMALLFGNIEYVEVLGDELRITGHQWVALAIDQEDPYAVVRLIGVEANDVTPQTLETLRTAADIYDAWIEQEPGQSVVHIVVNGEIAIVIHCQRVIEESRYYNLAELREICERLPSSVSQDKFSTYAEHLEKHGFLLSRPNGTAWVVDLAP